MDIATIKQQWQPKFNNAKAGQQWWNSKAEKFSSKELPTAENNLCMRIIEREKMVDKGSKVLDVGCGGGRFSFALETLGAQAVATDFSPEMVKKAAEKGQNRGSQVCFSVENWHTLDLKERGWTQEFDLVLAHMTPAVVCAETFLKLAEASRDWVLMVKPTRRTNSVLDALNKLVNAQQDTRALDETICHAFNLAWLTGGCPRFDYEAQTWKNKLPLAEAINEYTLRIGSMHDITDQDKVSIENYLTQTAVDGIVHEITHTTIVAMYWQVV